jgi:hypothetical protein
VVAGDYVININNNNNNNNVGLRQEWTRIVGTGLTGTVHMKWRTIVISAVMSPCGGGSEHDSTVVLRVAKGNENATRCLGV